MLPPTTRVKKVPSTPFANVIHTWRQHQGYLFFRSFFLLTREVHGLYLSLFKFNLDKIVDHVE